MDTEKIKPKVIVADDDAINRRILNRILMSDYQVLEAVNGQAALDILHETEDIKAVLLDLHMPVLDGYEFLDLVRRDPEYDHLPILAVTAADSSMAKSQVLSMGADDFLEKPVVPDVVLKRLETALSLQKALQESHYDLMTGLLNRTAFMNRVDQILKDAGNGEKCAFFAVDLDNFREANDSFGHVYGDSVLTDFGSRLQEMESDQVFAGRMSGDEFVLFLQDYKSAEELRETAECIQSLISGAGEGVVRPVFTCSMGISLYPSDGKDARSLYHEADQALYVSKRNGKNRYTFAGLQNAETPDDQEGRRDIAWILDELESEIGIFDMETDQLYYANHRMRKFLGSTDTGYRDFLKKIGGRRFSLKEVRWNGRPARLVSTVWK